MSTLQKLNNRLPSSEPIYPLANPPIIAPETEIIEEVQSYKQGKNYQKKELEKEIQCMEFIFLAIKTLVGVGG